MKSKLDAIFTAALVLSAVAIASALVSREFFPPSPPMEPEAEPVLIENWREHLAKGERMGPADAPVQLIEFADFECPFCASLHKDLKALRARYPTQVAVTYVPFPLEGHRFAEFAARAAACSAAQERFEALHDRLFEQQKEFGIKPWVDIAREAGVPNLAAFEACLKSEDPMPRIVAGKELGAELDVRGTPTLIVNGWRLGRPPSAIELQDMVKAILAGNPPMAESPDL